MQKLAGQGENLNGCDDLTRPIPTMRGAISAPQLQPCNRAGLRSALQGKGSGGRWGRVKLEGAAFGSRYSFILFVTGKAFEQYCRLYAVFVTVRRELLRRVSVQYQYQS